MLAPAVEKYMYFVFLNLTQFLEFCGISWLLLFGGAASHVSSFWVHIASVQFIHPPAQRQGKSFTENSVMARKDLGYLLSLKVDEL